MATADLIQIKLDEARKKWSDHTRNLGNDSFKRDVASVLLDNTDRYVRSTEEIIANQKEGKVESLSKIMTDERESIVYSAIATFIERSILTDICSVQPLSAPVGGIIFYDRRGLDDGRGNIVPSITRELTTDSISTINRRIGFKLNLSDPQLLNTTDFKNNIKYTIANAVNEAITIEVIGTIYDNVSDAYNVTSSPESFKNTGDVNSLLNIENAISLAAESCKANWCVISGSNRSAICKLPSFVASQSPDSWSYKVGELKVSNKEPVSIYALDKFPNNDVLLGRVGPSIFDNGAVVTPYLPVWFRNDGELISRFAVKVVDPDFYCLLKFES